MALTRGFSPAQFRDVVVGMIGPYAVNVTIASLAAGASSITSAGTIPGVQTGDVLDVVSPVATTAILQAVVTAAGAVSIVAVNPTGGTTFNPGAQTYFIVGFRFKTA